MFLGYKNNKIIVVANTATELDKMNKYCQFDKIEETDKEYFMYNGEYVCEVPFDQQVEEMRQARANAYASEVDPITAHINRLRDEEVVTPELEAEIRALMEERKQVVARIKAENPYPVI